MRRGKHNTQHTTHGVLTESCAYIFGNGSGTHSDPRIRRVGWAAVIIQGMTNCLAQTLECRNRHSERVMNSLKPTGGWMGALGEGNPTLWAGRSSWHPWWLLRAREATWSSSQTTRSSRKWQDRGWPIPRLGQGSNPDLWWRMSRALKLRQGTFTVQRQRAHVAAADIKDENHEMALVSGNEMADAVAKQAASEAAPRGAGAERVTWVDALAGPETDR